MFRHKPTALERISDAISDIGDRIVDLEERVVERVNPAPSATERMRRAIARNLPGHSSGVSRYVPDFLTGWSLPTTRRRSLDLPLGCVIRFPAGDPRSTACATSCRTSSDRCQMSRSPVRSTAGCAPAALEELPSRAPGAAAASIISAIVPA